MKKRYVIALVVAALGIGAHYYTKKDTRQSLAVYLLQHSPIPSTLLGPPKGLISVEDYEWKHPENYKLVSPASYQVIKKFPFNKGAAEVETLFFPDTFVLEINKGRIAETVAVTEDDQVIDDTLLFWGKKKAHPVFRQLKLPTVKQRNETIAIISSKSSDNYYHWLFDILPKLEILKRSGVHYDKIYINPIKQAFQIEILQRLGIDLRTLVWTTDHIEAKTLVVPSLPGSCGVVPKFSCDYLRAHLLPTVTPYETKKRIYISRSLAPTRRILNEETLFAELVPYGFEKVYLENLTVEEQIKLFASAEYVIAPHGAGLSNLVFCSPHTHVIELFNKKYTNPCFWIIGQQLDLDYHCLFFDSVRENSKKCDMIVDVDKIKEILHDSLPPL